MAVLDLDHDGVLDMAVLDDSGTPRVAAFQGRAGSPWFDSAAFDAALDPGGVRGLAVARITADGRADLVTASASLRQAFVIENRSGTPCARSSFAGAPRSYSTPDGPVSTAVADFNADGRQDLVVATATDRYVRVLHNANGEFGVGIAIGPLAPAPRAVVTADMNLDGHWDVVLARGDATSGLVQIYLGTGTGGLAAGATQAAGLNTAALVVGDFNGDGAPDVAAASEGTGQVFRFLGNGTGGLGTGVAIAVGTAPHSLVAGDLNNDGKLDLAVANSGSNNVKILTGNGDGTFTGGPLLAVGINPQSIAAALLNGDTQLDLVTADNGSGQVSVLMGNGAGDYVAAAATYSAGTNPTAVALLQLDGDPKPDIAVTSAGTMGTQTLTILRNDGSGSFSTPSDHPVRQSPQAITPIDADSDGLMDLAVPCRSADAVVILINRPPGPPVLSAAPRY
ncbi:MAG: VCBS repeat-containing protein, partial [Bauldia sp.]